MPVAKIHVLEVQYDEARLGKVSKAVQEALMSALGVPPAASEPVSSYAVVPGARIFGRLDAIGGHLHLR